MPGSAELLSSQPLTSQLDESNITDKSFNDKSDSEKSQWRQFPDPKAFFHYTGWSPAYFDYFVSSANLYLKGTKASFTDMLFKHAKTDLAPLAFSLKTIRGNDEIEWSRLPLTREAAKNASAVDDLMFTWIEIKKIDYFISHDNSRSYVDLLCKAWPKIRPADERPWYQIAARAFYSAERPTANGNLPSKLVYQQLLDRYKKYTKGNYLVPCTSMVGPSGIGKSFTIQQMAVQHGIYVAYTSFARKSSGAYPNRSVITDIILEGLPRKNLAMFWRTLITVSLTEVEVCR